jgi:hypothetical protein
MTEAVDEFQSRIACFDSFRLTLLIDGCNEILVIRLSPLHSLLFSEIKVTVGSTFCIYKVIKILIDFRDKCDCSSSHSSHETCFPSSHPAAACLQRATSSFPNPHPCVSLLLLSACS